MNVSESHDFWSRYGDEICEKMSNPEAWHFAKSNTDKLIAVSVSDSIIQEDMDAITRILQDKFPSLIIEEGDVKLEYKYGTPVLSFTWTEGKPRLIGGLYLQGDFHLEDPKDFTGQEWLSVVMNKIGLIFPDEEYGLFEIPLDLTHTKYRLPRVWKHIQAFHLETLGNKEPYIPGASYDWVMNGVLIGKYPRRPGWFPNLLPEYLFRNKKIGDHFNFTFGGIEIALTLM
jgi:hypothetical protein